MLANISMFEPEQWLYILLGGMTGASAAVLVIVMFYFFSDLRKQRKYRERIFRRLDTADLLMKEKMVPDALAIYDELLRNMPKQLEPDMYANIKHHEGNCYHSLSLSRNKSENLMNAIRAYGEALTYGSY